MYHTIAPLKITRGAGIIRTRITADEVVGVVDTRTTRIVGTSIMKTPIINRTIIEVAEATQKERGGDSIEEIIKDIEDKYTITRIIIIKTLAAKVLCLSRKLKTHSKR